MKLQAVLIPIVLAGCATMHIEPANLPLATPASSLIDSGRGLPADEDDLFVGLAFSGGGMRAGRQDQMFEGGNAYLDREYPKLDKLIRATIIKSN